MFKVFTTLLPVFGLILIGFVCRRTNRLGETAAAELNRFVVWLGLPALLFKVTATATLAQIWHPEFILVIGMGTLAVFALTVCCRLRCGCHLADASLDGLGASYANTGYVGIPLCLFVLGSSGLEPALVATLLVVCVLFSIAIVCIEVGLQTTRRLSQVTGRVVSALLHNPLVLTPLLGILWNALELPLPEVMVTLLKLLGDATVPCALVSLGAFLGERQEGRVHGISTLVAIKLVGHPLLTWFLAVHVFALPQFWAKSAVLLSALPTGTGPYMLAEFYGRKAAGVSRTVLYSTVLSVLTLSVYLGWLF